MTNKSLIIALSAVAIALIATIATTAYASNMMSQQPNGAHLGMTEEQCYRLMEGSSMENMHNSDHHGSMMGNSYSGGMMTPDGLRDTGSGGCH